MPTDSTTHKRKRDPSPQRPQDEAGKATGNAPQQGDVDMNEIVAQYGDCTLRELVLKYVDHEIDRLIQESQETLKEFQHDVLKPPPQ